MTRLLALAGAVLLLGAPGLAAADGDPASDVLLGQDVFLPYSAISQSVQRRLYAVTAAARQRGYPVKVALVGARTDLGVVTGLFGKPESYARFLSTELATGFGGPVLVVMPAGFGLAVEGRPRPLADLGELPIGHRTDALGAAAVAATSRIAAAAGHPLPRSSYAQGVSLGASSATVRHALVAMLVLAGLATVAIAGALVLRTR